eukprot:PLAT11669.1.p1 GENE.PLAT11669.1~~PLAT11669.1.p1  ORF type:complete len:534 (+),score=199.81 PLAT11669.1:39-1604(+)
MASGLRRLLECSLCGVSLSADVEDRKPRCLLCGHTFCTSCLRSRLGTAGDITCPECSKVHKLEEGASGVESLPLNRLVLQLIAEQAAAAAAAAEADEAAGPSAECGFCDGDSPAKATLFCDQCDVELCDECSASLHTRRAFASHNVHPLAADVRRPALASDVRGGSGGSGGGGGAGGAVRGGSDERKGEEVDDGDDGDDSGGCLEHRGEKLRLYCNTCDMPICTFCEKYGDHRGHDIVPLSSSRSRGQMAVSRLADMLREVSHLDDLRTHVESELDRVADTAERVTDDLEEVIALAAPLAEELEVLSGMDDDALMHGDAFALTEQAKDLCDRVNSALATLLDTAAFADVVDRSELAPLLSWASSGLTWEFSKLNPSYGKIYYEHNGEPSVALKKEKPGIITVLPTKQTVCAGTSICIVIEEMGAGASGQDWELGLVNVAGVDSACSSCWMNGCAYACYIDLRTWSSGDVLTMDIGTSGKDVTFLRNGSPVAATQTGTSFSVTSEMKVCWAARTIGAIVRLQ